MQDENDLDSPKVSGGLERFTQLIYQNANAKVIPFYYTRDEIKKKEVTSKLLALIEYHDPDILISNQDHKSITTNIQKLVNLPILWISHVAAGSVFKIRHIDIMNEFMNDGGVLAMVSRGQYEGLNKLSKRTKNKELILNGNLINPSFCFGNEEVSSDIQYDCTTIGRIDLEKNPFLLHKLAKSSDLKTLVISSVYNPSQIQEEYLNKNSHWKYPKITLFNLKYEDVMRNLSQSGTYLSTCARETWGITALESFARGVPVILFRVSANNYRHASEDIAPDLNFYEALSSKDEKSFVQAVEKLSKVDRVELSQKTKEKHSKDKWIQSLDNLIDKTIEIHKSHKKSKSKFDLKLELCDCE